MHKSYFLCQLNQFQLSKTIFPIGNISKKEVRKIAKENHLITADKKDSQGLCFIGKVKLPDFLQQSLKAKNGDVVLIDKSFFNQIKKVWSISESSGNFFDKHCKHFVYDEIVSKDFKLIKRKKTIAIAGGIQKASAIKSTLLNGCLFGLITDEEAAKHILNEQ